VRKIKLFESNLDLLGGHVDASDKSHHLAFLLGRALHILHLRVEGRELLEKLISAGSRLEFLGYQALHGERGWGLDLESGQSSKDGKLARDIQTVQVVPRIGLRVAKLLCLLDFGRPLAACARCRGKRVEEEGHGAAENALNLGNLITGLNKVLQRGDDRKASADGRLVVDLGAGLLGGAEDIMPQLIRAGESLLVGSHDADTVAEKKRVGVSDILGAGVIDEDGLGAGRFEIFDELGGSKGRLRRGSEGRGDRVEADGGVVLVVESLSAGGDVGENQLGAGLALSELLELADEALSNPAGA